MRTQTSMPSGEVAGAKFFTWAVIVVAAGLLVAVTTDVTGRQTAPATQSVVQTTTSQSAS